MKFKYIHQEQSSKLILFFNGWGMDESVLAHFNHSNYDVAMFYAYHQNKEQIGMEWLANYESVYLLAWSMGVYFASEFLELYSNQINQSIAINGTPYAIDNKRGIPKAIFEGTIQNLNKTNLTKFHRRMFNSKNDFERFKLVESSRQLNEQIEELKYIASCYSERNYTSNFDQVFIGQNDRIIPTDNQRNSWKDHSNITEIESGHFLFYDLNLWANILEGMNE